MKCFPFDLHVLSTPPAFILSQDQTLMFNVDPSSRSTSFFILVITVLIKNVRWFLLKSSEKFIRIFKVVLLFSCQRSFLWSASYKKLYHYITSFLVCQELFWFILLFWTLSFCNNFYIISFLITYVKKFFHSFQSQKWNLMLYFSAALSATLIILP